LPFAKTANTSFYQKDVALLGRDQVKNDRGGDLRRAARGGPVVANAGSSLRDGDEVQPVLAGAPRRPDTPESRGGIDLRRWAIIERL
jgi:hypothetical protein